MATVEFRFAVSPRLLLVGSWLDYFGPEPIRKMTISQVRNHNAAVMAQAEKQWFHHPDRWPERLRGGLAPLAPDLYGRMYDHGQQRRTHVRQAFEQMQEGNAPDDRICLIQWGRRRLPRLAAA
jgi:hypothetical protein